MSFVRTVLGDVPPDSLGVCYAHEHIIIDRGYVTDAFPEFLLDSVERASEDLAEFHAAGGRAMVDSMPAACGRNVMKLADVSRRTAVHILCPTGVHLRKYYPAEHPLLALSEDALAARLVADIVEGIDANDYQMAEVRRTAHRAGLIKVAGGLDRLDDFERKVFRAAAIAHRVTGAPILTHTEQGTAALEQLEALSAGGVASRHVVLSHTDRKPDVAYHEEILSTGAFVELDSAFRWKATDGNPTRDLIARLVERGFGSQILLGMDAARRSYWRSYGGAPGMTYLLTEFVPQLREAGLSDADVHRIFVSNPSRAYCFRATSSSVES
ncbi:MAG: aryldialkylphosphatase [Gemmatimonadaceae bacterium]